jgi:hypothetical protein
VAKTVERGGGQDPYSGMNSDFAARLRQMIAASGGRLHIVSGHRDYQRQAALYAAAVKKYGVKEARRHVAPPGHSNHEKGIAADLGGDLGWAHANAQHFGLYTPMSWEPWHFEPVGSRDKSSPNAYTVPPGVDVNFQTENVGQPLADEENPHKLVSHLAVLAQMLGSPDSQIDPSVNPNEVVQ